MTRRRVDGSGGMIEEKSLEPSAHILAKSATWDPAKGRWDLEEGKRVTGLRPDERSPNETRCDVYPAG